MALVCPECDGVVTVDVDEAEEGDIVPCGDCGADLEVVSVGPLELELVDDSGYDDPEETRFRNDDEQDDD